MESVQPDQCHRDGHVQQERQSERFEYQQLQRQAYQEQADGSTEHFGDEEEPGTRAVGRDAETVFQIFVDGYQVHFVKQRYQQIGYDELSGNEAQHHLQIAEVAGGNHAGYGYIGHTRNGGTDHGKRHDIPG